MLQSIAMPCTSPAPMPLGMSEIAFRSEPISRRLIDDSSFCRRITKITEQFRQDREVLSDSHPTCRLIASLFGPLQAHQRPTSDDACEAMARIKFLVQLMQQTRDGIKDLPPGFIANSITARGLASVFFPSNLANWSELINRCVIDGLESLILVEIDRMVGGDFVSYIDQQIDANTSIRNAVERDFQFSLRLITSRIADAYELYWLDCQQNTSDAEQIWPVIYQWINGEEVIPIPSSVNCQRIDWKQISELNYRVVESIVAHNANGAQQNTQAARPNAQVANQNVSASQLANQVLPQADKASTNAADIFGQASNGSMPATNGSENAITGRTKSEPFKLALDPPSVATESNRLQSVSNVDAEKAVIVATKPTSPFESSRAGHTEAKQRTSSESSLVNQYEQTIKANELFSDPLQQPGRKLPGSNAQSCDIRSANDPQLANLLDQLIDHCRTAQGMLSLLRIRAVSSETGEVIQSGVSKLLEWQAVAYKSLKLSCTSPFGAAFLNSDGDFSIVFQDLDRIQTSRLVRSTVLPQEFNIMKSSRTSERCGLVCGVATVTRPSRQFAFEQLAEAAERCLQGAMLQGRGSIKSLEVF